MKQWFVDAQGKADEKRFFGFVFLLGSLVQFFVFHDLTAGVAMASIGGGLLGFAIAGDQGK